MTSEQSTVSVVRIRNQPCQRWVSHAQMVMAARVRITAPAKGEIQASSTAEARSRLGPSEKAKLPRLA